MPDTEDQTEDQSAGAAMADALVREVKPSSMGGAGSAVGASILVLFLGITLGFVLATFGTDLIINNAFQIFATLLAVAVMIAVIFLFVLLFRRPLWQRIFRKGELEVERIARPLAEVARFAAEKRVDAASEAARELAEIMLARYAWVATRRWLVASLTGIIASIAALAGAALLFQQNELLKHQSALLSDQNQLITGQTERLDKQNLLLAHQTESLAEQNALIETQKELAEVDIQLAEASRSATLAPVIAGIASQLGALRADLQAKGQAEIKPIDVPLSLQNRIVAVTLIARPYRFLDLKPEDDFTYGARRSSQKAYRDIASAGTSAGTGARLIARPESLERGQLLTLFQSFGLNDISLLNQLGARFDGAHVEGATLSRMNFSFGAFRGANFDNVIASDIDWSSPVLNQATFRNASLINVSFASKYNETIGAVRKGNIFSANFSESFLIGADFSGSALTLTDLRGALLQGVVFDDAGLAGVELKDAIMLDVSLIGTDMRLAALDGLIVSDPNWLNKLRDSAKPGTFLPERWKLDPLAPGALQQLQQVKSAVYAGYLSEAQLAGKNGFRVVRVEP